ncbi:hypothetical protein GB883_20585, partial [Georgenia thermotolerans]
MAVTVASRPLALPALTTDSAKMRRRRPAPRTRTAGASPRLAAGCDLVLGAAAAAL